MLSLSDLGALTCRKEPANLAEIIEDVLAASRTAIAEKGLQVQAKIDDSILVEADADRLGQVFSNLLQNTLRYSESPARLFIHAVIDGAHARIEWEDSPPGVADADLHRLTERLYRADESRARASGCSGLGLAIVKAIIDAHGGRMQAGIAPWAACAGISGCHFRKASHEASVQFMSETAGNILVVEDEDKIAEVLRDYLRPAGLRHAPHCARR